MSDNAHAGTSGTENTTIQVDTPAGMIRAEIWADPVHPGVQVMVGGELATLVEFANGNVIVRLYGKDTDEVIFSWDFNKCMPA